MNWQSLKKTLSDFELYILYIYAALHEELYDIEVKPLLHNLLYLLRKPILNDQFNTRRKNLVHKKLIIANGLSYSINLNIIDDVFSDFLTIPESKLFMRNLIEERSIYSRSYIYNEESLDNRLLRNMRFAFYVKDEKLFRETINSITSKVHASNLSIQLFNNLIRSGFNFLDIHEQPAGIKNYFFGLFVSQNIRNLGNISDFQNITVDILGSDNSYDIELGEKLAEGLVFEGDLIQYKKIDQWLSRSNKGQTARALYHFLSGNYEEAEKELSTALKLYRKAHYKRTTYFTSLELTILIFLLLHLNTPKTMKSAKAWINYFNKQHTNHLITISLLAIAALKEGDIKEAENQIDTLLSEKKIIYEMYNFNLMTTLIIGYALYFVKPEKLISIKSDIEKLMEEIDTDVYSFFMGELKLLHTQITKKEIKNIHKPTGYISLLTLFKAKPVWQYKIEALINLGEGGQTASSECDSRLVWKFSYGQYGHCHFQPIVQKLGKREKWTKGRNVAISTFATQNLHYLTDQDRKVIHCVKEERYGYYGRSEYYIDGEQAAVVLCGHPLIFDNGKKIELAAASMDLVIKKERNSLKMFFPVSFNEDQKAVIIKENDSRYLVYEIKKQHKQILSVLGDTSVVFPKEAEQDIHKAAAALSSICDVHGSVTDKNSDLPTLKCDMQIYMTLLPDADEGFRAEMVMKPLGEKSPLQFRVGSGGETVFAQEEGKKFIIKRSLIKEINKADAIISKLPSLQGCDIDEYCWELYHPETCLSLLEEIQNTDKELVVLWPQGVKLKFGGTADYKKMSVTVKESGKWFDIDGSVKINDNLVVNMLEIIKGLSGDNRRFIRLDDQTHISISRELSKKLRQLSYISEKQKDSIKIHSNTAFAIDELVEEASTKKLDSAWIKKKKKRKEALSITPELPSIFQGELRDYQKDGFLWMMRLAALGMGACLADDMGLGKTIQALSVIAAKASVGPSLVVAPTSLCFNWEHEAQRFTPALTPYILGTGDRKRIIENLESNHLLIVSYSLLINEIELLEKKQFSVIVFDESQALKNPATQRSKAAKRLKGNFFLSTTGTPIENNLNELWSLFSIINPGILGSLKSFTKRFIQPIEQHGNKDATQALKQLIAPFILRRLKTDVLSELPEKTEITIAVKMTEQERAFYEAHRLRAVQRLESSEDPGHIAVLAELMKLRRISCNPTLIKDGSQIQSSKLIQFKRTVAELKANNHKALVFSQFVDHLAILKNTLDEMGISYQYLDGSTPQNKRKKAVESFQSGKSDLFLISLKAGGTGLNLTAANYVIHMDPWWNPAVEDQASDRVHRIGQKQPVTVYRIIMEHSIESKILELHSKKRHLADTLLQGQEAAAKLSLEELKALMEF